MATRLRTLALGWETLRRTTPRQIFTRITRRARFRWLYPRWGERLYPLPPPLETNAPKVPAFVVENLLGECLTPTDRSARSTALAEGRFYLLRPEPALLNHPIPWLDPPGLSPREAYELHYGHWALNLLDAGSRETLEGLLESWIDGNPVGHGLGWHGDPTSRRLVAFSRIVHAFEDEAWRTFCRRRLEPSLRRQARFLAANLEHDVPNNHLLGNYRALSWVGLLFPHWPEANALRRLGLSGLWREMERQVLPDGVHDERSPAYHALVLGDLLETWHLARALNVEVPAMVQPTLERMTHFLRVTRYPDGTWPAVNDSLFHHHTNPQPVLEAAERWLGLQAHASEPHTAFPHAGYAVLRDGQDGQLFFDAGPMGPVAIPGHGHADILAFEVHGAGRPLLVDRGTETYDPGPSRDSLRGIATHNTLTVDGQDPCIFWGPFRVAYPPDARLLETTPDTVEGEHRGYLRLDDPVLHRRRIHTPAPGRWIVTDHVQAKTDHRYTLTLQLAPGARLQLGAGDARATWPEGIVLEIRWQQPFTPRESPGEVAAGWYCTETAPRLLLEATQPGSWEHRLALAVHPG